MASFSQSTIENGSENFQDFLCSTCEEMKLEESADFHCELCMKLYCQKCIIPHDQLFIKHSPCGREDMKKWPVSKKVEDATSAHRLITDTKPVDRALVRYSYVGEHEDELSLTEGEIINVLDKDLEYSGWWRGELNGRVGVFPDNFVELIKEEVEVDNSPPAAAEPKDEIVGALAAAVAQRKNVMQDSDDDDEGSDDIDDEEWSD